MSYNSDQFNAVKAALAAANASVSLNSQKITSLATPTTSTDAATKGYADGLAFAAGGIAVGSYASLPAPGTSGRVYRPTDGYVDYYDNGTDWVPMFNGKSTANAGRPGLVSGWTALNSVSAADDNGVIILTQGSGGGVQKITGIAKSVVTGSTTRTAIIQIVHEGRPQAVSVNGWSAVMGMGFRDSSTGRIKVMDILLGDATTEGTIVCSHWAGFADPHVDKFTADPGFDVYNPIFLKVVDDTTNVSWSYSRDGFNFADPFYSEARLLWSTTGTYTTPDQFIVTVRTILSTDSMKAALISYKLT